MKKTISVLLLLVFLAASLFACADETPDTSAPQSLVDGTSSAAVQSDDSSAVEEETSGGWVDGIVGYLGDGVWGREMPEFTWDRDTFNVLVYSNNVQDTYFSEEIEPNLYDTTDSIINDAVRIRNDIIEERYGVKIKAVLCDDVYSELMKQLSSGGKDCADAAMPFLISCAPLAQSGQLYDLREFEKDGYIDLSMPWWEENATETFSISDKVYFAIGDMSIMQKIVSSAVMFNKDLLATKYPDLNLYEEVREKRWTIDMLYSIAKDFTYESDGTDGMSWTDTWGFGGTYGSVVGMYQGSGAKLIDKDADGNLVLAVGNDEASISLIQSTIEKLIEKNTWVLHAEEMGDDKWNKCIKIFGEGTNMFRGTAFSGIKKVRAYDVNFGLVPMPLMSETQDEYYTPCAAKYAYGTVIPYSAPDPEFSAFMLDVMCALSKGENATGLTRAYIEVVLKGKDLKADEEACDILDNYIFNNIVYDLGIIYNLGIDTTLTNLVAQGRTDVVSALESIRTSVQTKLDELMELYAERS